MNFIFGLKRWAKLGLVSLGMVACFGCDRSHSPLLATPGAGANQLTVTLVSFNESAIPEIQVVFDASTDLGPVTDLLLGNVAILVDSRPEIPLKLNQDPITSGRYTLVYRARSTNSASVHKIYVAYGDLPVIYFNP